MPVTAIGTLLIEYEATGEKTYVAALQIPGPVQSPVARSNELASDSAAMTSRPFTSAGFGEL